MHPTGCPIADKIVQERSAQGRSNHAWAEVSFRRAVRLRKAKRGRRKRCPLYVSLSAADQHTLINNATPSLAGKNPAPSENIARETASPSAAKTTPTRSRSTSAKEGSPVHAVITKIDRMKTRQGDSFFLKVDVGGETVRVRMRSKLGWNSIFPVW